MNRKLKYIASLINKEDKVIDIGCDHAYLAIYLKKNNLCSQVYASDISKNALEYAKKNLLKENINLELILCDGFPPNLDINTGVISGMGTNNILHILNNVPKNINKLIISSNNDYYLLRKELQKKGFYLKGEQVICEKGKFYPIMVFNKSNLKRSNKELKYGISKDPTYYNYLLNKEMKILKEIPSKHLIKRRKILKQIKELKHLQKESRTTNFN